MAAASVHVMNLGKNTYDECTSPMSSHINVGTGEDISIAALAEMIGEIVGYEGDIEFDPAKPDGTPQKLMDSNRINSLGWQSTVRLEDGLVATYGSFLEVNS